MVCYWLKTHKIHYKVGKRFWFLQKDFLADSIWNDCK